MNNLLEELFGDLDNERYYQLINEIQKACEDDPKAWMEDLEIATTRARDESGKLKSSWDEVVKELERADTIENKAKAFDIYFAMRNAQTLFSDIWDLYSDAGYCLYCMTENPEAWAARKNETVTITGDDPFPFVVSKAGE